MKTTGFTAVLIAAIAAVLACAPQATVSSGSGENMEAFQFEPYNGPKARVAVARFTDKTAKGNQWWNPRIGDGMADMMASALMSSGKFIVLEREVLDEIYEEQQLQGVARRAAIPQGQMEAAELLVVGAVTEFEPDARGLRGAAAAADGGLLGGILGGAKKSHVAIDVRVVDTRTRRILASTTVEAEATDFDVGGALIGLTGGGGAGAGLGAFSNTPIEKAVRVAIVEAVKYIGNRTPANFFHYEAGNQQMQTAAGGGAPSPNVVYVRTRALNMRSGPGTNWSIVTTLSEGTALTVLETGNGWHRVRTSNGEEGWVSARYVAQ